MKELTPLTIADLKVGNCFLVTQTAVGYPWIAMTLTAVDDAGATFEYIKYGGDSVTRYVHASCIGAHVKRIRSPYALWRPIAELPFNGSTVFAFRDREGWVYKDRPHDSDITHFITRDDLAGLGEAEGSGMNFIEAVEAMKAGKKVLRPGWGCYIYRQQGYFFWSNQMNYTAPETDVIATDWEIYEEPKPKTEREIAEEEFEAWWSSNVGKGPVSSDARNVWLAARGLNM